MAIFQNKDKQIKYELFAGVLPADTLFIHDNLAFNPSWHKTAQLLKLRYKNEHVGGSLALAEWRAHSGQDLSVSELAQDYLKLIHVLGLNDLSLVGHGVGGLIALSAVLQEPSLFHKVLLLNPEAVDEQSRGMSAVSPILQEMDLRRSLAQIKQEVLILHGEPDPARPSEKSRQLAQDLPRGQFTAIKDHGPVLDNPAKFVDLLCDFLY